MAALCARTRALVAPPTRRTQHHSARLLEGGELRRRRHVDDVVGHVYEIKLKHVFKHLPVVPERDCHLRTTSMFALLQCAWSGIRVKFHVKSISDASFEA